MKIPEGKFIATVKVGEKGQIVIPKGARDIFGIEPGDTPVSYTHLDVYKRQAKDRDWPADLISHLITICSQ